MPSSVINFFSYDEKSSTLKITFVTGMVYCYQNVPKKTFEMLKIAGSKGRYFNHYIKDKFKFKKLEE
ncbi:MAG: KTSC domain-containing protein [Pedobacter sp.]|nr:MAG: KTSC domain-containing protein [Pedobacter sp.]